MSVSKPYPDVWPCKSSQTKYRILRKSSSKGSVWMLQSEYAEVPKGASDPKHGDVKELLSRYAPILDKKSIFNRPFFMKPSSIGRVYGEYARSLQDIERFRELLSLAGDPESPLNVFGKARHQKVEIMTALYASGVCQKIIDGGKHYGLFFEQKAPVFNKMVVQSMSLAQCNISQEEWNLRIKRTNEYYNGHELADQINRDWVMLDALARPFLEDIEKAYPTINDSQKRYITKIVATAYEAGIKDKELEDIVYDLGMNHQLAVHFIYALQTIVLLRFAKMLHLENIKRGGKGISKDFVDFVDTSEMNVREDLIKFRVMSLMERYGTNKATYNNVTNTVSFSVLSNVLPVINWMDITVHELYHSYQDAMKMKYSRFVGEGEAYARGIKAEILLDRYRRRRQEGQKPLYVPKSLDGHPTIVLTWEDKVHMMKCMGYSDKDIKDFNQWELRKSEYYRLAKEGFREELDGRSGSDARAHAASFAAMGHAMSITEVFTNRYGRYAWLHDLGYRKVIEDLERGARERLNAGIAKLFSVQPGSKERMLGVYRVLEAYHAASSALYFLDLGDRDFRGNQKGFESFKRTREFNRKYEFLNDFLEQDILEFPQKRDGL